MNNDLSGWALLRIPDRRQCRKIAVAVGLLALIFLAACGGNEAASPPPPTDVPPATEVAVEEPTVTPSPVPATATTTAEPEAAPTEPAPTETVEPTVPPTAVAEDSVTATPAGSPAGMVFVPGGVFSMGDDPNALLEECQDFRGGCQIRLFPPAGPVHEVSVNPFYIDSYEVTNQAYAMFLNEIGGHEGNCFEQDCLDLDENAVQLGDDGQYVVAADLQEHPVVGVSWFGAATFCQWRGARLPTEAEWEMAASWDPEAQTKTRYPWGDTFDPTATNFCDVNCEAHDYADKEADDGYAQTAPVGSYEAGRSPLGLFDMSGNVWEWVLDWFDPAYYDVSNGDNPRGPETGEIRVVRGGSWFDTGNFTSAVFRTGIPPELYDDTLGFRCAADG